MIRDYLRTVLLILAIIVALIGFAFFWRAVTFEQYMAALVIVGVAGLLYIPAHFLNPGETGVT